MNKRLWLCMCAGLAVGVRTAGAEVWYVATNGSDTAAGTNWATAYATIGNALASNAIVASQDHEIWVSNGTYNLGAQLVLTKGVRLRGAGADKPILDGGGTNRCVFITNGVLDGFTVTNGYAGVASYGGGIYVVTGQVLNCTVVGNRSDRSGGGIYGASGGEGIVSNCVIAGNIATNYYTSGYGGGGAYFGGSGWKVLDCPSIRDNQAYYHGGGLKISGASLVSNCVVSNNTLAIWGAGAKSGGGLYLESQAFVTHCTLSSNYSVTDGGGAYVLSGAIVSNCTVRQNESRSSGGGISVNGGFVVNCPDISENYTGTGGTATARGGGIYGAGGAVVSNCVIRQNTADSGGGGVACSRSTCTVADCVLEENVAIFGGGMICHTSKMKVMNCLVTRNRGTTRGGGIEAWGTGTPLIEGNWIENCTVVSNYAGTSGGGGMYLNRTNAIINTIIYSNDSADITDDLGYDIYNGFTNCCTPGAGSLPGERNIPDYPQFADPENANWRLTFDSPCVNAGTNHPWVEGARDLDGHARADPFSRQVDIGAFEFLPKGALIRLW